MVHFQLEIKQMDLRVGVLSHTVLSHTFLEKKWHHERDNQHQEGIIDENDELSDGEWVTNGLWLYYVIYWLQWHLDWSCTHP